MSDYDVLRTALIPVCARVLTHEPMARHTTFRVGGEAALVAVPSSREELIAVLRTRKEKAPAYPLCILGNGSNVVFADEGFDGLVVLTGQVKQITMADTADQDGRLRVTADCGTSLTALAGMCMKDEYALSGLEFAYGIPACIGGAVVMNAGAYGGEMANVLTSCDYFDPNDGDVRRLTVEELAFSYRHSIFADHPDWVVLGAELALVPQDAAIIRTIAEANMASRREKQPLEYPNAGSIFKRPQGHFAGKLIEDSGLKGYTVGGAQVSQKHAGFIVNRGGATAADIQKLVRHIQNVVRKTFGIELECEIKFIG